MPGAHRMSLHDEKNKAFLAQRVLMTRKTKITTLYLIHRIMLHVARPGKSIGLKNTKKVFEKRQLKLPTPARPLAIRFLAHSTVKEHLTRFLQQVISRYKHTCLPLNIPCAGSTVEAGYITIASLLHNFQDIAIAHEPESVPCTCSEILTK